MLASGLHMHAHTCVPTYTYTCPHINVHLHTYSMHTGFLERPALFGKHGNEDLLPREGVGYFLKNGQVWLKEIQDYVRMRRQSHSPALTNEQ